MNTQRNGLARATLVVVVGVLALGDAALGQLKKERKEKRPAPTQPSAPNQPANAAPPVATEPIADKVLVREKGRDWSFRVDILIQSGPEITVVDKNIVRTPVAMQFSSVAIVFPMLDSSASHALRAIDGMQKVTGEFLFNDAVIDTTPTIAQGYQSGTKLARWEGRNLSGKDANLKVSLGFDCFDTVYDDALAETIPWPRSYPPVSASALKPQMFVEYLTDPSQIDPEPGAWLKKQTGGNDPKAIPPAQLAKFLAGRMMEDIQPSGKGFFYNSSNEGLAGTLKGFDLRGAGQTLRDGRGSPHDIACALAAVYKAAGIPARTVIGYDVYEQKSNDRGLGGKVGGGELRSWVEFCLIDPVSYAEIWVPVDVVRMRKAGSRAKPLDQRWKYFGTNDELSYVMPLAFHYHPPTTVTNIVPALWGWLTNPGSQPYANTFQFTAFRMPKRGDEPRPGNDRGR
ncbi:MAG: transglutaminase-like domain-containing protein [Phycisphaerales bacterium]